MNPSYGVLVVLGIAAAGCGGNHRAPDTNANQDPRASDAGTPLMPPEPDTPATTPEPDTGAPSNHVRPTRLVLTFTTVPQNGRYAPSNIGAAWVADAQSKWVHTFELWASANFVRALSTYVTAGGPIYARPILLGLPGMAPPVQVPPDVITSATLRMHKTHAGETWDLKDMNGNEVPDGRYSLVIEVAEQSIEQVHVFSFVKAGEPARRAGDGDGGVKDVQLSLE